MIVVFRRCRKPDWEILRILWCSKDQLSRHTTIFFKEFAHTAGKAYWPVSARVGLAWPEELHWNAARTEELPVNQILLNNCNMTSNDFVDKCLNIS